MAFFRTYLLSFLFVLTGCIHEDLSNCPVYDNLTLSFVYTGDGQTDIFPEKIEEVTLYIFDKNDYLLTMKEIDKSSLNDFQGTTLHLEKGKYRIICWANQGVHSAVPQTGNPEHISSFFIIHPGYINGDDILTSDSLYYAGMEIFLTGEKNKNEVLTFFSAHIKMEIYVEGYNDSKGSEELPFIEITNLHPEYSFLMEIPEKTTSFVPEVKKDLTGKITATILNTFRFSEKNDIKINIIEDDNKVVYSLSLKDFIKKYNIRIDGIQDVLIPIHIRFGNNDVNISVADWNSTGSVKPIF